VERVLLQSLLQVRKEGPHSQARKREKKKEECFLARKEKKEGGLSSSEGGKKGGIDAQPRDVGEKKGEKKKHRVVLNSHSRGEKKRGDGGLLPVMKKKGVERLT